MPAAPLPPNEQQRLQALRALEILDTAPEAGLDALVKAASLVCGVPISLISLVDEHRQWFKSNIGLPGATETHRDLAFCAHAILQDSLMEVPDALQDPRFAQTGLVTGTPHIRYYAGMPLTLTTGECVGTLCVIDTVPRTLDPTQRAVLAQLGTAATQMLENRQQVRSIVRNLQHAQEAQQQSEARYRHLVQALDVGVAIHGPDTSIQYVNGSALRLLGLSEDQMLGKTSFDPRWNVVDALHQPLAGDMHPSALAAQTGQVVRNVVMGVFRPESGDRVWLLVTAVPELDEQGHVQRVTVSFSDITEQRKAEEAAARTHQILNGSIDALSEAFALYDADDRLALFNKTYFDLFPKSMDAVQLGNTFEHILRTSARSGMFADEAAQTEEWVQERLTLHRQPSSELVYSLPNGRVIKAVEKRMPNGYTVGFRFDITDLVRATEAAEQASRSKGQFLATMSHEIRTPMNAILGMLQLLHGTDLNTRQEGYVQKTEGAARSLLGILNDILDFSKVEAGKMQLDPEPFSLDRMAEELGTIVAATVGSKPVELLIDVDPRIPKWLVGDALRLKQVLINLAGNAVKFTAQGQVVIRVKPQADGGLLFQVQDSGIGMSPEQAARVFAGFSQAEASIARRYGGTGLGLAISQRLVKLMGGELAVNTTQGVGSIFYFAISLPHARQASLHSGKGPMPRVLANARALVLHHDEVVASHWADLCHQVGWVPELAYGHTAALAALEHACLVAAPKQLLLLNWQMAGTTAVEFVWQVQALHRAHGAEPPHILAMTTALVDPMAELPADAAALVHAVGIKPLTRGALRQMASELASVAEAARNLTRGNGDTRPGPANVSAGATGSETKRRLAGLSVLLAEDNLLNQEVAKELLGREGAEVFLAENGQVAVEMLQAKPDGFHVVLMDMQMPVMDGLQATLLVRHQLGLGRLPILAMTANAMASDRDLCFEVGMNGHVGKPFDIDDLVDKILEVTGKQDKTHFRSHRSPDLAPPQIPRPATPRVGLTDHNAALKRFGGDTQFFGRLLRSFAATAPGVLEQGFEAIHRSDWLAASGHFHTLKGTASTLGATELARAAAEAEACVKRLKAAPMGADTPTGNPLADLALLRRPNLLADSLDILFAELRGWEAAKPAAPVEQAQAAPDSNTLNAQLAKLVDLLKRSDMEALELFDTMRDQGLPQTADWQAVHQCMDNMDFEAALAAATAIAPIQG